MARDLNNLASLLFTANRLAEAEPLMRRAVEILLRFTLATGYHHPPMQAARDKYAALLTQMGRRKREVLAELNVLAERYGVSFDG